MVKCNLTGYIKQVPKQAAVCKNINELKMLSLVRKGSGCEWHLPVVPCSFFFPFVINLSNIKLIIY